MATITRVTMGREGHYRFIPLVPGTSTVQAAECECGATWTHGGDPRYDTFCEWAVAHHAPTIVRATVECAGSGGLIYATVTDGWRQFDPHPVFVAVKP